MELIQVGGELRELKFENRTEVTVARLCLRARASTMRQTLPLGDLEPRVKATGTEEQKARRLEFSTCNAVATALHERGVNSFTIRGDAALVYGALVKEFPKSSASIPPAMTEPKVTEMSETEFKWHAKSVPAHIVSEEIVGPLQTA